MAFIFGFIRRIQMKEETRQEISAAYAKDYTEWMVKTGGYARDMTMRDEFAGLAMQKIMGTADIDDCCETAYKWADAMLKERAK
jgi:hypothetical protein